MFIDIRDRYSVKINGFVTICRHSSDSDRTTGLSPGYSGWVEDRENPVAAVE